MLENLLIQTQHFVNISHETNREFFYVAFIPVLFLWTEIFCLHDLRSSETPNIFDSYSHSLCCKQITLERDIWWIIQSTEEIDQICVVHTRSWTEGCVQGQKTLFAACTGPKVLPEPRAGRGARKAMQVKAENLVEAPIHRKKKGFIQFNEHSGIFT